MSIPMLRIRPELELQQCGPHSALVLIAADVHVVSVKLAEDDVVPGDPDSAGGCVGAGKLQERPGNVLRKRANGKIDKVAGRGR